MVVERVGTRRSGRLQKFVLPGMVILLLATLILFLPPYLDSFIGDDFVQQWRIRKLIATPEESYNVFRPDWTNWYYRPLQNLWFLGNRLLLGLLPSGYYYLQVLWHLLSISLIYNIARRIDVGPFGAFVAALLFAINSEHHLTVDWVSSIGMVAATMLSLVSVMLFLNFLRRGNQARYLILVILLWVAALLFHETAILMPVIYFWIWLTDPGRSRINVPVIFFGAVMAGISLAYVLVQFTRENANLEPAAALSISLEPRSILDQVGNFVTRVFGGWLSTERIVIDLRNSGYGGWIVNGLLVLISGATSIVIYLKGTRAMRLGVIWAVLQLTFVLVVLWLPRPDLLGGRHLYSAWVGLSLILGAAIDKYLPVTFEQHKIQISLSRRTYALAIVLLFIAVQIIGTRNSQSSALALTKLTQDLENQIKEILPTVTDKTRVFASRFILTPSYFAPVAGTWYADPTLTGGDIDTLKNYPKATKDFFVFDYEDGFIYNLMPELQQAEETFILWSSSPVGQIISASDQSRPLPEGAVEPEVVAGPEDDRMIALSVTHPGSDWISLGYQMTVPLRGSLAVSILGPVQAEYRVKVIDDQGLEDILMHENRRFNKEQGWIDLDRSLVPYAGQTVTIALESRINSGNRSDPLFWGNPRIVVD
jgi:hypothetical protein